MPFKFTSATRIAAANPLRALRVQRQWAQQVVASAASQQRHANSRRQEAPIVSHRSASRQGSVAPASPRVNQFVGPAAVAAAARFGAHRRGGSLNTRRGGPQGQVRRRKTGLWCKAGTGFRRRPFSVRPNPSFELTRYGRPVWPVRRCLRQCLRPGQTVLPHRAAQFKR